MSDHLLEIKDLKVSFFTPAGEVKAVNGVTYDLDEGRVLGIVGESGSGKSVSVSAMMQLLAYPGRVVGGILMSRVATEKIFLACALGTVAMLLLAMSGLGLFSKMALIVLYVFESIMFPTIFALSIQGLGANTEKASSILMMSVVGGAIGPLALGYVADHYTMTQALVVPLSTFVIVLAYAIYSYARRSRA